MRKEILFAILAGIFVGLIIAFGAWRANSALNSKNDSLPETSKNTQTAPLPTQQPGTTLAAPDENDVLTQSPTKVSGITKPLSWLVISGEDEDYVPQAKNDGSFEQEVKLVGGVNQILVKSFNEEGSQEQKLTVVLSTEFEKDLETN